MHKFYYKLEHFLSVNYLKELLGRLYLNKKKPIINPIPYMLDMFPGEELKINSLKK